MRPPTSSQDDMASLVATPSLHGLLDSHLYQIHLPSSTSPATQRDASAALAGLETLRGPFRPTPVLSRLTHPESFGEYHQSSWNRGLKAFLVPLADDLHCVACRKSSRGYAAAGRNPLPSHVEPVESGQSLLHLEGQLAGSDHPPFERPLPIASVAVEGDRRGYI